MTKKGKKGYRHYTAKIPVALAVGFASTVLGGQTPNETVLDHLMRGEYPAAFARLSLNFTGQQSFSGHHAFDIKNFNLMPLFIGAGVSILASKLGVNRRLASMGLPFKL